MKRSFPRICTLKALCLVVALSTSISWADEFAVSLESLRAAFQDSLRSSAFRPKFDHQAFDFLEALIKHRQEGNWIEMFRLIDRDLELVKNQVIPAGDGVWLTVGQWWRRMQRELPAEAVETIRLYVDGRARAALAEIESEHSIDRLYELTDRFAISSYGSEFANHLGDALFESGNYYDAAIAWNRMLNEFEHVSTSETQSLVKRAFAFRRMGDDSRLSAVCEDLMSRFHDDSVRIGGRSTDVRSLVGELMKPDPSSDDQRAKEVFLPSDSTAWRWSVYWPELENAAKKGTPIAFAANRDFAIVNLGYAAAGFDRHTGKLIWIHEFDQEPRRTRWPSVPNVNRQFGFAISGIGRRVHDLAPVMPLQPSATADRFFLRMVRADNQNGIVRRTWSLRCLNAKTGKLDWTADEVLSDELLLADPITLNRRVYVVTSDTNSNLLTLHELDHQTGNIDWSLPLGSINVFAMSSGNPTVRLTANGDRVLVEVAGEAAFSVNVRQRSINWLYRVKREKKPPSQQQLILNGRVAMIQGRKIVYGSYVTTEPLAFLASELQVFILDPVAKQLICRAEDATGLMWTQENISGTIVLADGANVYVLDDNKRILIAVNRRNGKLAWEIPVRRHWVRGMESVGGYLFLPTGTSILRVNVVSGDTSQIQPIAEAGEVLRIQRVGDQVAMISPNSVTIFSVKSSALR